MESPRELSGHLTKRGGRVHSWKYRYFTLINKTLSYYAPKDQLPKNAKPKGVIDLSYGTCVGIALFEENKDKNNSFYIRKANRTYLLYAANKEDRTKWLSAITEHLNVPNPESVEFITNLPVSNVKEQEPLTQEEEEKIFSTIILTGIPNEVEIETIKKHLKSSNILEEPECKKIFVSRKGSQWIALDCQDIERMCAMKEWVKTHPIELNNKSVAIPAIIPRCRYSEFKEFETGNQKGLSKKTFDVYIIFHRDGKILRMTIPKKKAITEELILKKTGIDHVRIFDIGQGFDGEQSDDRILSAVEYGYFPQDLKYFLMKMHMFHLGKFVHLNLEATLGMKLEKQSQQKKKQSISKQKGTGSRFEMENQIKSAKENPLISNILINAVFKLKETNIRQENYYLFVGNDFFQHNENLHLQMNLCDGYLIKKRNMIENDEEESSEDEEM
ncbi:sesquipedalian [Anaeramoeba flamelloides]|uniref:Sesquipedalian n=1 Tax=Anaeramoeba flamelloides TaxID=1746091 RepID=A0AAV7ZQG7_9EUKA|nr:sesquipedalian [Anaeramoeba flamelloides]KAJ6242563.1 sesquipedalian [Anaeramoeba flamelloides]